MGRYLSARSVLSTDHHMGVTACNWAFVRLIFLVDKSRGISDQFKVVFSFNYQTKGIQVR